MLQVGPEVFVKWLAMQDYVAVTVAVRSLDIAADLWWVRVVGSATGSEATPFDATVT